MNHTMNDERMKVICELLKTNKSFIEANILSNEIGDDTAKAFGEVLKTNRTLKQLALSTGNIS